MSRTAFALAAAVFAFSLAGSAAAQPASSSPVNSLNRPAATAPGSRTANVADLRAQLANNVGYRVYLQEWNPAKPDDDTPKAAIDKPSGISGPIDALWDQVRAFLTDPKNPSSVPALLGKGNLIAKGITLYNITFTVNPLSELNLIGPQQGVVSSGQNGPRPQTVTPNSFSLHLHIPGTKLDFQSTTPDVDGFGAPQSTDPKLSAQIDLDITLGLAVGAPGQPYLQVTDVKVVAQKPKVDSGNFTGDLLVGITDFLSNVAYGKSLNALLDQVLSTHNLAADPANGGFAFGAVKTLDLKKMANDYLKPVNDTVAASGVTRYLRTGVWVKSEGSGDMLVALFAPQALPLPPQKGAMSGTVQFDASVVTAGKVPSTCANLVPSERIDVEVQTGPRPVLDVDPFRFGQVPMQRLAVTFGGQPAQSNSCKYALSGLALGIPNKVAFAPPAMPTNGSLGSIGWYLSVEPANWMSPVQPIPGTGNSPLPQGFADVPNHNLVAKWSIASNPGAGAMKANAAGLARQPTNPGDPEAKWGGVQQMGQPAAATNWGAAGVKPNPAGVSPSSPRPGAAPSSLEQRQ